MIFFTCAYCSLVSSRKQHVEINTMIIIIIINMQIRCKKRNVAHQSTLGKLIGKQKEVHCSIPRVQKGDMTAAVKDGASIETQWLMELTAIKNRQEKREIPVLVFHIRVAFQILDVQVTSSVLLRELRGGAARNTRLTEQNDLSPQPPSLLFVSLSLGCMSSGKEPNWKT